MSEPAPEIKSATKLPPESQKALRDLILSLADSKRILGILYADWVLGAPELEANIAASSMAQDEWGHSRILYALLKDFGDEPERLEHAREPAEYCNIEALDQRLATWPQFVVANAVVDTALTVQLESLAHSRFVPLRQRVQKQLEEERFHESHGAAWLRRLGVVSGEARSAAQKALDARWSAVLHWFGPVGFCSDAKEAGLCSETGAELRGRFVGRLAALIEGAGLVAPEPELDFSGWDPASRRSNRAGPHPESVARARGDRNQAFLVD